MELVFIVPKADFASAVRRSGDHWVPAMSSKCLDRGCAPRPLQGWRGPRSGLGLCRELPRLGRGRRPTRLARAAVRSWELRHELFLPRELLHHAVDSKMTGGGGTRPPSPVGPTKRGGRLIAVGKQQQAAAASCRQSRGPLAQSPLRRAPACRGGGIFVAFGQNRMLPPQLPFFGT